LILGTLETNIFSPKRCQCAEINHDMNICELIKLNHLYFSSRVFLAKL